MNKLLKRQLKKYWKGDGIPKELEPLLNSISLSYDHFEKDRQLIERSMEISSEELREALTEAEEYNKTLEEFAYIVAHDLRTPVRTIVSFNQLILKKFGKELPDEATEYFEYVITASKNMNDMFNGLLEYVILGNKENEFERVDMNEVSNLAATLLKQDINQRNTLLLIEESLPHVNGNKEQLTTLLMNLIGNALKHSNVVVPVIKIAHSTTEKGNHIFSVTDNGPGVAPKYADKIFRLFHQLIPNKKEGAGIGLALCKGIVEKHKGNIWLDSEYTDGARFYFSIPLHQKEELVPEI